MRRYFEYGVLAASILTLVYLIIAFLNNVVFDLQTVGLCVLCGIATGFFISLALYFLSPGEAILEGEEDKYIK